MKSKLAHNLSVNTLQLVINQVFGLGIFYVLSTGLNKDSFGRINLVSALLLAVFNILSFGIDQLVVKKIAAGANAPAVLSLYVFHVIVTGIVFYGLLILTSVFFKQSHNLLGLLLLIGSGKLMLFFAMPFKQAANGLERFKLLAYMSVMSNLVRCCGLLVLALTHRLSIHNIVAVFITGDGLELVTCIFLFRRATNIRVNLKWNKAGYFTLLREALPQTGVVLITSALARFDWLFIGFMVSAVKLAEYSFAYKVFELSTLPLLAIAPLLIPRFTKMVQQKNIPVKELKLLLRGEIIIAVFAGLLLNMLWGSLIDLITKGKYGAVNSHTIFILSLCMPLLYLNNFLWTIYFAQGRLKMILTSFILTFSVNVAGDVLLIPYFKNEGAAIAFFASCVVQAIYYLKKNTVPGLTLLWQSLVVCTLCAAISGFTAKLIFPLSAYSIPLAILIFFISLFISRQLSIRDGKNIRRLLFNKTPSDS